VGHGEGRATATESDAKVITFTSRLMPSQSARNG